MRESKLTTRQYYRLVIHQSADPSIEPVIGLSINGLFAGTLRCTRGDLDDLIQDLGLHPVIGEITKPAEIWESRAPLSAGPEDAEDG
jgi:hypothetical protein